MAEIELKEPYVALTEPLTENSSIDLGTLNLLNKKLLSTTLVITSVETDEKDNITKQEISYKLMLPNPKGWGFNRLFLA